MRKIISILSLFAIVALCVTPLFFPNDAEAKEPPQVHASDLDNTQPNAEPSAEEIEASYDNDVQVIGDEPDEPAPAESETPAEPAPDLPLWQRILAYARENMAETIIAVMAILQIIVNLTPTEKDNGWFLWLRRIFDTIFPNLKKGGGTFKATPKA